MKGHEHVYIYIGKWLCTAQVGGQLLHDLFTTKGSQNQGDGIGDLRQSGRTSCTYQGVVIHPACLNVFEERVDHIDHESLSSNLKPRRSDGASALFILRFASRVWTNLRNYRSALASRGNWERVE